MLFTPGPDVFEGRSQQSAISEALQAGIARAASRVRMALRRAGTPGKQQKPLSLSCSGNPPTTESRAQGSAVCKRNRDTGRLEMANRPGVEWLSCRISQLIKRVYGYCTGFTTGSFPGARIGRRRTGIASVTSVTGRLPAGGLEASEIVELQTATPAVVQSGAEEALHQPQRVPVQLVDAVALLQDGQLTAGASRTVGIARRQWHASPHRYPLVTGTAAECGAIENTFPERAVASSHRVATRRTGAHRSG